VFEGYECYLYHVSCEGKGVEIWCLKGMNASYIMSLVRERE